MPTEMNATAAAARAAEARRRAEEARRRAEAARERAAAAAAAKKTKAREKPSTRFEALEKGPARRESKSTRFEALGKKPVRRESKSTRFEAVKLDALKALDDCAGEAGLTPADVAKVGAKSDSEGLLKLSRAISTLADEKASAEAKALAAASLGGGAGRLLPEGARERLLDAAFEHLEHPHKIIAALDTLEDPNASGHEKADASVDLALGLKASIGKVTPSLAGKLAKVDGPVRVAAAAFTLVDGESSPQDRAIAAAQLGLGVTDLKYDVEKMTKLLQKARLPDAAEVAKRGDVLQDLGRRGLDLDAVKKLPPARLQQLTELSFKLKPEALKTIGPMLDGFDANAAGRFLKVAGSMKPQALDEVLGSADEADDFARTLAKLDPDQVEDFTKAASKLDGAALRRVTTRGAAAPDTVVNDLVPALSKFGGGEAVNKALGLLDKALGVMKVDLDPALASKALKGLGKLLPGISVGVSGISAFKFGGEAVKLQGRQDDLAYLAHTGVKLNAADAVLEFIPGFGTLAGVGTGVAALALDLGFTAEKAKFQKDPNGYEAPDWVKGVNVGMAMLGPPPGAGLPELVATYGVKDAAELGLWAVGQGGKLAEGAWELIKKVGGPAAEVALEAVDTLKDLGAAGVDALEYIAKAPGELGEAIADAAVERLEQLGEVGVEALKSIASSGAAVAKRAAEGLKNLADAGLGVAQDALGTLKDVPGAVGDFVSGLGDLLPDIDLPGPL
ncbi:MAG: hypothetical protein JNK82_14240 [Myxococcaceae bacterium]|nr:hypothetical protein [Myxococcaceae bacterium]